MNEEITEPADLVVVNTSQYVPHRNMEEAVLGPYSSANGGYGKDDLGFHVYCTLKSYPILNPQETAFMARYESYQVHLKALMTECINGVNSTEAGRVTEEARAAKIARTDAGGDADRFMDSFIQDMLAKDGYSENVIPETSSDCEIVSPGRGEGGAARK